LASIRVRFLRHAITCLGIALGIAFFASIQMLSKVPATGSDAVMQAARLKWLVVTSMVMCLVGVTNSMLMSVTERYREIGTIKCLGASDSFIVKLFFVEAALLGSIGSVAGAVLGAGLMGMMMMMGGNPPSMLDFVAVVLLATGMGIVLTVAAAIAPAIQAAKMPAAAALRVEV
jgi:ABC-type antimicrobial peptide transport system permease subunit